MSARMPADRLLPYHATDRRLYNGAACSDMQREAASEAQLRRRMQKADATARCTYFPAEAQHMVFVGDPGRPLTGRFHHDGQVAMIEAIELLEREASATTTTMETCE